MHWAVPGKMVGALSSTSTVTREQALIAHTRSNAYLFFRNTISGRSRRGGSLTSWHDKDYLTIPADRSRDH